MKNQLIITTFLCFFCCCCQHNGIDQIIQQPATVVELHIVPDEMIEITRATDDKAIEDINLFLYFPSGELALHLYSKTTHLRFTSPVGSLTLAIAANIGYDLDGMPLDELDKFTLTHRDNYDYLPMNYRGSLDIRPGAQAVELPIVLTRSVARIEYNIMLVPELAGYSLSALQIVNVPKIGHIFNANEIPSPDREDYFSPEPQTLSGRSASGTIYLFQNQQGVKFGITDQRDKNAVNAPANATFLRITAARTDGTIIHCSVYLGENNTSDFNIRGNTSYTLNINILGANLTDTRICRYAYNVTDNFRDSNYYGGYCVSGERHIIVAFSSESRKYSFEALLSTQVPSTDVILNGSYSSSVTMSLTNPSGAYGYPIDYRPGLFNPGNSILKLATEITDEYDFTRKFETSYKFSNGVKIYYQKNLGIVTSSGGIGIYNLQGREPSGRIALCWGEGCKLAATPANDYSFGGWYSDAAHTKLVSSEPTLEYVPAEPLTTLYPKFSSQSVAIYTEIDTMRLTCSHPYVIDRARKAFIVPKGSQCTIGTRQWSFTEALYDGYDENSRNWLGSSEYTLTATKDITVVPKFYEAKLLDELETANCYMPSSTLVLYSFDATKQGNGKATTHINPKTISTGAYARIIWEETSNKAVYELAYNKTDRRIYFTTPGFGDKGNAVIGLFDKQGNCLWSWHIWYNRGGMIGGIKMNDHTFMILNLGGYSTVLSDTPKEFGYGLYYQWGRKDPFMRPRTKSQTMELTKNLRGYEFTTMNSRATIEQATAHPTTFYNNNFGDWISTPSINLWGNASQSTSALSDASAKSIYDPCPPGWRVPPRKAFVDQGYTVDSYSSYVYLRGTPTHMVSTKIYTAGYYDGKNFIGTNENVCLWTNAPCWDSAFRDISTSTTMNQITTTPELMYNRRDQAMPVRCIKE